jgi:hypothetical protein
MTIRRCSQSYDTCGGTVEGPGSSIRANGSSESDVVRVNYPSTLITTQYCKLKIFKLKIFGRESVLTMPAVLGLRIASTEFPNRPT